MNRAERPYGPFKDANEGVERGMKEWVQELRLRRKIVCTHELEHVRKKMVAVGSVERLKIKKRSEIIKIKQWKRM